MKEAFTTKRKNQITCVTKKDRNYFSIVVTLLLCLVFADQSFAYTVLSPVSRQPILIQARRPQTSLIIKLTDDEKGAALPVVSLQNRTGDKKDIAPSALYKKNSVSYAHYTLILKKGKNSFVINPGRQELNIYFKPVRTLLGADFENPKAFLFHRKALVPKECKLCHDKRLPKDAHLDVTRLKKNSDFSPICFSCHRKLLTENEWLHGPTANLYCMSCHRKGTGNTRITMLTGRVDDVCFQCHINKIKIKSLQHVHGPVGTGDCTICHDPHGDAYKYQLWADGKIDLCVSCHSDKKNAGKRSIGFYPHGIISGGGCVACHSPHASNYRFQLSMPINKLCVSCHLELADVEKGHPVGNHPLKGKADPLRKGRMLSCTSCHNPHGSNYRYLLIGDILGGHVCSKCHEN